MERWSSLGSPEKCRLLSGVCVGSTVTGILTDQVSDILPPLLTLFFFPLLKVAEDRKKIVHQLLSVTLGK